MNFWEELRVAYYDMVELKVSLGYNEGTYRTSHILPFVEYCSQVFPSAREITKEMLDSWLKKAVFRTENTRKHVIINLRHFTRYLNATGRRAFVPTSEYNVKAQRYPVDDRREMLSIFQGRPGRTTQAGTGCEALCRV